MGALPMQQNGKKTDRKPSQMPQSTSGRGNQPNQSKRRTGK